MAKKPTTKKPSTTTKPTNRPPTISPSPSPPPPSFKFNFTSFTDAPTFSSPLKKQTNNNNKSSLSAEKKTILISPPPSGPPSLNKSLSSLTDLKEMTSANVDSIKRLVDCSHSEIVKDIEGACSRLHKRVKIQNQSCQEIMNEAEKEFKKINDFISENHDTLQVSYKEMIAETQASANRVCKRAIPELMQSVDKAIDTLKNRYGIC